LKIFFLIYEDKVYFPFFWIALSKSLKANRLPLYLQYLSNYQVIAMLLHLKSTDITRQKHCFYLYII